MYSNLEMSSNPNVSIWGTTAAGVGLYHPMKSLSTESIPSTCSPSSGSTPEYSHSLNLESTMLLSSSMSLASPSCMPTTVIAGQERHPVCKPQPVPPRSINPRQGRRNKSFVDPCEVAPLKKRRIQLQMLSPDERDKVVHKREKNKVAAEKCRIKRREKMQHVRIEYEEFLEANESLEKEMKKLQEERDQLEQLLQSHNCIIKQQV